MRCNCPDEEYELRKINGKDKCVKTKVVDTLCPDNYEAVIVDGKKRCRYKDSVERQTVYKKTPIYYDNEEHFEEKSWTISYKPTESSWQSYWTFSPDYYVNHVDFFQIGFNYGQHSQELWSHYLGNQSFQVFQGKKEPWIVEVPMENKNTQKILSTVYVDVEAKRYNSSWDYAENSEVGFNKMVIYNGNNHSGELRLNLQKSLKDVRNFPKTNGNESQEVLYSTEDGKHKVDYFFNRVKNQNNNIPLWLWDQNRIQKETNPQAISFFGKKPLERMRGEQFVIRLQQDTESRYGMELKTVQTELINYR